MILISVIWRGADVSPRMVVRLSPKLIGNPRSALGRHQSTADPATELTKMSLEPASPAVPAATEKDKQYEDDDQKCRGVHVASCACCER
jgi:hypothetical protein